MKNLLSKIENETAPSPHQKIWDEVVRRLIKIPNATIQSGNFLRLHSKTIRIKAERPSGSDRFVSMPHVWLDENFLNPVPLIQSYKLTRGTRVYKLVEMALALFKGANRVGAEALSYAMNLEEKLREEFKAKTSGEIGLGPLEEYADYPRLAIFICERQWDFTPNGLSDPFPEAGPATGDERHSFSKVLYGSFTVWRGETVNAENRVQFIDSLLLDNKQALAIPEEIKKVKTAAETLSLGKNGLQMTLQALNPSDGKDVELEPTKLCYTALCHTVCFGDKTWAFHNGAKVIRVLIDAYERGLEDIHVDEIQAALPKNLQGLPLSQIFKSTDKGAAWKNLVVAGTHGKGFYRLNPEYLENGVKEIRLGLPAVSAVSKDKSS